jgi:hypothetical protein
LRLSKSKHAIFDCKGVGIWVVFNYLAWYCFCAITSTLDSQIHLFRVCLFSCSFYVWGVKNIVRCLVIHQTAFYIVEPIKKIKFETQFLWSSYYMFF